MVEVRWIFLILFVTPHLSIAQVSDSIAINLRHPEVRTLLLLRSDEHTALLEVLAPDGLTVPGIHDSDFVVTKQSQLADLVMIDTVHRFDSNSMRIAFVLDNSESMFDAFDSLTTILDTFIGTFHSGIASSVTLFDNVFRTADHYSTKRDEVFVAQLPFTFSHDSLMRFWHMYDTIRSRFTPLYDALGHALRSMMHDTRDLRADVVIVVSDGADNGSITTLESLRGLFRRTGVRLFTLNYQTEVDPKLVYLGRETLGANFSAQHLADLRSILLKLAQRLSIAYRLDYRFPQPPRRSSTLRPGY